MSFFCSSTAKMMIAPLTASHRNVGTPTVFRMLFITPMMSMPSTVPTMEPLPPDMLVPPTTTAAMASISADSPEVQVPEYVQVDLLTPNPYSRPQKPLEEVRGIVVHYVANPCSTARENRSYFEQLKDQTGENATSASSHFVIGLEGEVVQCVPLTEVAYASNHRNSDTISIECCHPDETGKFYDSTYESLVELCAYFCTEFKLKPEDVIRHYDVTGKICPKYFVDHEDAWEQFHKDVEQAMKKK